MSDDIIGSLADGVLLINLVEIHLETSLGHFHQKPSNLSQKLENCQIVLKFLRRETEMVTAVVLKLWLVFVTYYCCCCY